MTSSSEPLRKKKKKKISCAVANMPQDVFDAHGRFWWATWLLPRWAAKRGNGVHPVLTAPWR